MKTQKGKYQKYKLFKYNILKLQIYSNKSLFNVLGFSNNLLEQIEAYLKQILKITYEYHVHHFKILFIGFPIISKVKQKRLLNFTNHNFISEKSWISGILRNRFSILTYLKLIQSQNFSKSLQLLLTIKAKPHLVIIFNQKVEPNIVNEFYKLGIPILSFDWNFLKTANVTYKALGNCNFLEKNVKLTFFFLFYSLLKKTPIKKKNKWNKLAGTRKNTISKKKTVSKDMTFYKRRKRPLKKKFNNKR